MECSKAREGGSIYMTSGKVVRQIGRTSGGVRPVVVVGVIR